jgi:hypothetical protein
MKPGIKLKSTPFFASRWNKISLIWFMACLFVEARKFKTAVENNNKKGRFGDIYIYRLMYVVCQ